MLPWKSSKTVSTKAELDDALTRADRIVVEGGDELISYALAKSGNAPSSGLQVARKPRVVIPDFDNPFGDHSDGDGWNALPEPFAARRSKPSVSAKPSPFAPPPSQISRNWSHSSLPAFLFLLAVGFMLWMTWIFVGRQTPSTAPTTAPEPEPSTITVNNLAWPIVTIVAIVALYLIARQAIAAGNNVDVSWQVTEKMKGRLVITKVKTTTRMEKS